MTSSSIAILLGLLLASGAATAQSEALYFGPGARRIEFSPEEVQAASEIVISAGLSTTLLFDVDLKREDVELEGRDRFELVDLGQTTLRLVPSSRVTAAETFRLVVHFRDGAAPVSASFLLRVHPVKAQPLVEVYRRRRTVATYQQEVRELRAELTRVKEENARVVAEHEAPAGLAGLISTGAMDEHGVLGSNMSKVGFLDAEKWLTPSLVRSYRSTARVAVETKLAITASGAPWRAKGAMLRNKAGAELKVLRIWQEQPISDEEFKLLVVEAEAPAASVQGPFSLKLWEADGPRTLTLRNITFPEWP
ncbi:DUF2381 family protein [Corallococcus exiguus]|uniref:DUF2381 family protein n=1 Tax=Corallococcus exiguus TaxID=83462 RepID=UPI0015E059D3|nr:DUF2381 family protein [Corallococcus exiguus]